MAEAVDSPEQLIDITPPPVPLASGHSDALLVIVVVVIMVLLTWAVLRWYRSERQQSIRRLNRLRRAFQARQLTPREASYWLAAFLKWRLHLNHLSPGVMLPEAAPNEQRRWRSFMQRLHEARYAHCACKDQEIMSLLADAKHWVRRWP